MPQSTAMLTQMGMGYAPFAEGVPHTRRTGFEGVPFMNAQGPMGMLAQMGLAPAFNRMMGQSGMVPMGVGHDQNVYDTIRNMNYTQMQMRTMQIAAESDRDSYMRTFRGLAAVTGTPFGAEQRRAAQSLSSAAVMAAPILSEMMPEFVDQMGGLRGSATVMARRMIDSGRYRVDPISGRMGMSAETTGELTNRLFRDLYSDENIANMHGVTAGQLGGLFEQLQMRGMVGSYASERGYGGFMPGDPRGQVRRAVDDLGRTDRGMEQLRAAADRRGVDLGRGLDALSGSDLDKLMSEPEVGGKLRAFDAERIKRSLQGYVQAVGAMRDIFGDMGHPNAPMQQIVQGLEAMTMGSMGQIDSGRLSMMVRQTYNLAKQTGVTIDNAMVLQQHAGQRAQQMGVEPIFGMHAAQGALGFGGAYRAQGHAAHTAWGAMTADQVQQLDANLRVQASGSNMANRMAVAMRLRDTVGGFEEGSEAGRYTAAISAGMNQFVDSRGRLRSVALSNDEFVRMMGTARGADGRSVNFSEGDVRDMLQQRDTNREFVDRYGLQSIVRRAQGTDELHPFVGNRMQETLTMRLRDNLVRQGVGHAEAFQQAREAARSISQNATRRMFQMSTQEFSSTSDRNRAIGEIIEDELTSSGHGEVLRGLDGDQRTQFLQSTAERFYGHANRAIQGSMYRAFGNLQNVHRLTNEATHNEADRQQMQARFTAQLQDSMAPLGRGTVLSRAVDALQHARPDDPNAMMTVIAQAMGGVRTADINRALLRPMTQIRQQQEQVETLRTQISQTQDPTQRSQLMRQLDVAFRELNSQAKNVAEIGERYGMFADQGLSSEELRRTINSGHQLTRTTADLHGVRTGAGSEVTAQQIADVRANPGTFTPTDAAAVLLARRMSDIEKLSANAADTTVSQQAREAFTNAQAEIRRNAPGMNDAQVNATAIQMMRRHADRLDDPNSVQQLQALVATPTISSDEEARALVRTRRRLTPTAVTQQMIDEIMIEQGDQITEGEAREVAATRLRAQRMGLRPQDVEGWMTFNMREPVNEEVAKQEGMAELARTHRRWWGATTVNAEMGRYRDAEGEFTYTNEDYRRYNAAADPIRQRLRESPGGWRYQVQAIDRALADQQNRQYTVTPEDRENYLRDNRTMLPEGINSITPQMVEAFRRQDGQQGIDDATARQRILDRLVLGQRTEDMQRRFQQFWQSEGGAAYREQVDYHMQDVENVSQRLISTPQMVRRLGTRAIGMHNTLNEGQQRLRDLALYYSRGDLARLTAGDFDVPITTQEGQETAARIRAEVQDIQRNINVVMEDLQDTEGREGPQWELGDERQATREVLQAEVAAGRMTQAQMDTHMRQIPDREQRRRIRRRQFEMGSETNARQMLGIPADLTNLTEWQQAKIAGVRYGAGTDEEVIGALGRGRYESMSQEERATALATLRRGTQDRNESMRMLGLQNLGRELTDEEEERVQAATVGFQTDAHARQLAGISQDLHLNPAGQRLVRAMRMGTASESFARHSLGMPDTGLTPALMTQIQQRRELAGNEQEARRMLNISATARAITEPEQNRMREIMRGARLTDAEARRAAGVSDNNLTAEQQTQVDSTRATMMSDAELRRVIGAPATGVLTAEQGDRISFLRGGTASEETARVLAGLPATGELSPLQRPIVQSMQRGFGNDDAVREMFGITGTDQAATDRIRRAREGISDEREARRFLGLAETGEIADPRQREQLEALRMGMGTRRYAAHTLGIDANKTDEQLSFRERMMLTAGMHGTQSTQFARMIVGGGADERMLREAQLGFGTDAAARVRNNLTASGTDRNQQRLVDALRMGVGSEAHARVQLGLAEDTIRDPTQRARVDELRRTLGGDANVRRAAGVAATGEITDATQRRRMEDVRVGYGSDTYARRLLGVSADDNSADTVRRLNLIRTGTNGAMGEADARRMLGFAETGDLNENQQAAIRAVRGTGSGSDLFVAERLGINADQIEANRERILAARFGVGTEAHARHTAGAAADNLTDAQRARVDQTRDAIRNNRGEQLARAALGLRPGETLTTEQTQQLQQLTREIGVARRLTPEQERMLLQHSDRERRMLGIAESRGATVDEMREFTRRAGPDGRLTDEGRAAMAGRALTLNETQTATVTQQRTAVTQGNERLTAARTALNNALRELRDNNTTPERRRELTAQLGALRQGVSDAENQVNQGHRALRTTAREAGATTSELVAGRRSGRKLEALSEEEERLVTTARRDYGSSTLRLQTANRTLAGLRAQLAGLDTAPGMNADTRERRRASLMTQIERAEVNAAEAMSSRQNALQSVGTLADGRGVTALEMLRDRAGYTTAETRRNFGQMNQEHTQSEGQITELSRSMGVTRQDVLGGATVTRRLDAAQQNAQTQAQQNPQNLVRQIYQAYGLSGAPQEGQQLNASQNSLAQLMTSAQGRGLAQRIIGTQGQLRDFATRGNFVQGEATSANVNQGIGRMADEYFRVLNGDLRQGETREAAMRGFQQRLGIDFDRGQMTQQGERQWQQFQQAMQFQQRTRFLQLGAGQGRTMRSDQQLFELYRDAMQGGEMQPTAGQGSPGGQSGQGGPLNIQGHLTGRFTFDGPNINMVANAGGNRNFTVPAN